MKKIEKEFFQVFEENGEVWFFYKNREFVIHYDNDQRVYIYETKLVNAPVYYFNTFAELVDNFILDGMPLRKRIPEMDEFVP